MDYRTVHDLAFKIARQIKGVSYIISSRHINGYKLENSSIYFETKEKICRRSLCTELNIRASWLEKLFLFVSLNFSCHPRCIPQHYRGEKAEATESRGGQFTLTCLHTTTSEPPPRPLHHLVGRHSTSARARAFFFLPLFSVNLDVFPTLYGKHNWGVTKEAKFVYWL